MIDVYFWPTPNGKKITIALEELELPYRLVPVNIRRGDQFRAEFLAISPNNRMPAIVDDAPPGGGGPLSVFESGAILIYLAEKAGHLLPSETRARAEVLAWLMWQMSGVGPMLGQAQHFSSYAPEKIPYAIERYTNETHRLYRVLDTRLVDREFVAGEYSIADIAVWPWILPDSQGQSFDEFPNLKAWHARVKARPAVERGANKGGELRSPAPLDDAARKVLFGQR
jgi:GST-like protein